MITPTRRSLLSGAAALLLPGCATKPPASSFRGASGAACELVSPTYPTPYEIYDQFAPQKKEQLAFCEHVNQVANFFSEKEGVKVLERTAFKDLELEQLIMDLDSNKFFANEKISAPLSRAINLITRNPWHISVSTWALPFGYKHLRISIYPRGEDSLWNFSLPVYFIEGMGSQPEKFKPGVAAADAAADHKYFDINDQMMPIFGTNTLFGHSIVMPQVLTNNHDPSFNIPIDYRTALNFMSVAAQFLIEFNAYARGYTLLPDANGKSLPQGNSNSFIYSLLKHALGKQCNFEMFEWFMQQQGWKVPGYGVLLLPEFKPDPNLLVKEGQTAREARKSILSYLLENTQNYALPRNPRACIDQAKIYLVLSQLKVFAFPLETGLVDILRQSIGKSAFDYANDYSNTTNSSRASTATSSSSHNSGTIQRFLPALKSLAPTP